MVRGEGNKACTHSPVVSHWFVVCVSPLTWAWAAELSSLSAVAACTRMKAIECN